MSPSGPAMHAPGLVRRTLLANAIFSAPSSSAVQVISAWVVSFGLLGCSAVEGTQSSDSADRDVGPGQVLRSEASPVLRPDGSAIVHHIKAPDVATPPYGLVLVAQGSGCRPAGVAGSFPFSERIAPGFARLIVEKYGADPAAPPPNEDTCSSEFYERDTLDQRVRVPAPTRRLC